MIVRLTGGKIVPSVLSVAVDKFCIFTEEYSLELDDFSNFLVIFGDWSRKFKQTQYQNETLHSLLQSHVFAPTLQLSFEEKDQLISRTCSPRCQSN